MSLRHEKLPVASLEQIDSLCNEFENAWQLGQPPSIESVVERIESPAERTALLGELLALDIDYRRKRGESPVLNDYLDRFPEQESLIERAIDEGHVKKKATQFEPPTIANLAPLFPSLEILELIGSGGMGAVYKARQRGLDRLVAIKILPDEVGRDPRFALRFTREARALARLNHPNIVSIYEFGHSGGTYYFLMEFVDGSTLRDVIQSHQLQPQQALAIVPHLCDALQYAHNQGVVHRDIKPENILLGKDGQVKIADFGLSRLLGAESQDETLTGTHQVMGTLRYMAPEQLEGAHQVDHRADIYSLGVVFYEMLTGELPLGRFSVPSKKVSIDVRLDDVVLRTLEKEPQRRYQRASQVKSDLESITASHPQQLAPTADVETPTRASEGRATADDLERQERAARVLLVRRELMSRVERALRPLFWGQIVQMFFGIILIGIGVQCWVRNMDVPHRVVSGALLHAYGVLMILAAGVVCGKIKGVDYSKPVDAVREQLDGIRLFYLRAGAFLGLSWWLLWIPLCVAVGLDVVAEPVSLAISVGIGLVGLLVSGGAYWKFIHSRNPTAQKWTKALAGESLRAASVALEEIAAAEIR